MEEIREKAVTCAEDKALKVAMQAFGENVMKYLGQEGTVRQIGPTEFIHLEARQMYEDFNFEMMEGYWLHYEFESDGIAVEDMRRFREYEAFLSLSYQMPVITVVLCSANVKKPLSTLLSMNEPLKPIQWSSHPVSGSGANVCHSPGKSMNIIPASILVLEHDALSKYPAPLVIYTIWYSLSVRRLLSGNLYPSG